MNEPRICASVGLELLDNLVQEIINHRIEDEGRSHGRTKSLFDDKGSTRLHGADHAGVRQWLIGLLHRSRQGEAHDEEV